MAHSELLKRGQVRGLGQKSPSVVRGAKPWQEVWRKSPAEADAMLLTLYTFMAPDCIVKYIGYNCSAKWVGGHGPHSQMVNMLLLGIPSLVLPTNTGRGNKNVK